MRIGRILTALAVTVVCGLVMALGLEIVWFSAVQAKLGPTDASGYSHFVDFPGVEFSARDDVLTAINNSGTRQTNARLTDAVTQILAVKPVSAGYWLSLARIRLKSRQSFEKVMDAWSLSVLTGPNEGHVLPWRAIFGLSLWDKKRDDLRRQTIADLDAALPRFSGSQQKFARTLLSRETEQTRHAIRSRLLAEGASEKRLAEIGLQ